MQLRLHRGTLGRSILVIALAFTALILLRTFGAASTAQPPPQAPPMASGRVAGSQQEVAHHSDLRRSAAPAPAGKVFALVAVRVLKTQGGANEVVSDVTYHSPVGGASHTYTRDLTQDWSWILGTAILQETLSVSYPEVIEVGQSATFSVNGNFSATTQGMEAYRQGFWRWAEMHVYGTGCRDQWQDHYADPYPINSTATWSGSYTCSYPSFPMIYTDDWGFTLDGGQALTVAGSYDDSVREHIEIQLKYRAQPSTGTTTIQGYVHAITETDRVFPIIGVPVQLLRDGQYLRGTITDSPDGRYVLTNVPITTNLVISVTLRHDAAFPSTFQVSYGKPPRIDGPVVAVSTKPFNLDAASPNPYRQDIIFAPNINSPPLDTAPGVPQDALANLGLIYYHTHQAWQLTNNLSQPLDLGLPVDVVGYGGQAAGWLGPRSDDSNLFAPVINFSTANSTGASGNRPDNLEWHEFGHHVMADMMGNRMPEDPRTCPDPPLAGWDCNHWGYVNATSNDSWTEGFAEYYSLLVGRDIAAKPRPELYRWVGREDSLEANYMAWNLAFKKLSLWSADEEFAVAGLLWDLTDPVDADDASVMTGTLGIPTDYADCIALGTGSLWSILATDWDDVVPRSPDAVGQRDYSYLYDVKHLYDVLKSQGIGSSHSRGRDLSDLDELFAAHGFFADLSPTNQAYDPGETIGPTSHMTYTHPSGVEIPAIPVRRDRPVVPGSFIAVQAVDADTGAPVAVRDFLVDVRFAPPFEHYSYSFRQSISETPGRLFFYGPDPQYQATTSIIALGPGSISTAPLTVTNAFYWQQMQQGPDDVFMQHTFSMQPQPHTFLPFVARALSRAASAVRPSSSAARAHVARACVPDEPTPTPTSTATPTPGPLVVESIDPASAAEGTEVRVTIYGYFFEPSASPYIGNTLLRDVVYLGAELEPPHRWRLQATLPAGLAPGVYDVTVVNPGGRSAILPNGFTVTQGQTATPTATGSVTATPTATATPSPTPTATPTPTVQPGWQVIFADSFEAPFPGSWQRLGNPGWGRTSCKSAVGAYSVWPAADGTGAVAPCVNNYPDNLNAWLIYGPFSLQGATAAELTFQRWQRSEAGFDHLSWMASIDGDQFWGLWDSGDSGGWVAETFDLSDVYTLGDLRGQPQVWVAFRFQSNENTNDLGAFVDDVVVRKRTAGGVQCSRRGTSYEITQGRVPSSKGP